MHRGVGRPAVVVWVLLFGLVGLAGCARHSATSDTAPSGRVADSGLPAAPVPSTTPGQFCLTAAERSGVIWFPSENGAFIAGVVLGPPKPVGFVLAHQSGGDMCDWVPYGRTLVTLGYTVLAIDLNGFGASSSSRGYPSDAQWDRDVVAAAGQLRRRGVGKVVLMGASLGGMTVVAAAARLAPPAAAVVDLSGPSDLSGVDALAAAPHVTSPILFVAAQEDSVTSELREVALAAKGATVNRVEIIPGGNHGISLLQPDLEPRAAQVSALIVGFVRQYAGG